MRKSEMLRVFGQRLIRLGFAQREVRRRVSEMADHWEDLKEAALNDGLLEPEADDRAARQLGDPIAVADGLAKAVRQSCWYGRKRWFAFCLLPPFLQLLFTALIMVVSILVGELLISREQQLAVGRGPSGPLLVQVGMSLLFYVSATATAFVFCWLARRAVAGLGWALAACGICALHSYFWQVKVVDHTILMGYYFPSKDLLTPAIPLVAAAAVWFRQKRRERQFETSPAADAAPSNALISAIVLCALACALTGCADRKVSVHERGWVNGQFLAANPKAVSAEFLLGAAMDREESLRAPKAGILVKKCDIKAPAAVLHDGDVILELNHQPVTKLKQFSRIVGGTRPGTLLPAKIYRGGETLEVQLPVGREAYHREGSLILGLPTIVHGWDLWPNPGFSLVLLGYEPSAGLGEPGDSDAHVTTWRMWAGVLEFSSGRKILSRENLTSTGE
jgi:PDZ domain-containing protein